MSYKFPHQEAIEDNGIDIKKLPKKVVSPIYFWNAKFKKYEANPSDKAKDALLRDSVKIADAIQDYVEQGLADGHQNSPKPPQKDEQQKPDPPAPIPGMVGGGSELKDKIMECMAREKGRIYHSDLKKILGKREIDDKLEVEGMVLERSWGYYYPIN